MSKFGRRRFLQGLGLGAGATLLTPIADRLLARAYGQQTKHWRAVFIVVGDGMLSEGEDGLAPTDLPLSKPNIRERVLDERPDAPWSPMIATLEPVRRNVLLVDGLYNPMGITGNHGTGYGALSCFRPGGPDADLRIAQKPLGQTIDQYLATRLGVTPVTAVTCGLSRTSQGQKLARDQNTFATGPGRPISHITNPNVLFEELFGVPASPSDSGTRRLLLDSIVGDIRRLRQKLAPPERHQLDDYEAIVVEFEQREAARKQLVCDDPPAPSTVTPEAQIESMFDMATVALRCGVSNVAGIAIGTGHDHWEIPYMPRLLGGDGAFDAHNASKQYQEHITKVHARLLGLAAEMYQQLDNTVVVYTTDGGASNAYVDHHTDSKRWPVIIIGEGDGVLRTGGRYVRYSKGDERALGDVYSAVTHAVGVPTDEFGKGGVYPTKGLPPEIVA